MNQEASESESDDAESTRKTRFSGKLRLVVFAIAACGIFVAYVQFKDRLNLNHLVQYETELRTYQQRNPVVVYAIAFAVYCLATGASLPGATVLTLVCGWYFGFWRGFVFVSFASTTGATLAFIVSRYVFRTSIEQKFASQLAAFDKSLQAEGPFYLFTLRLIPAVPFFVINAVMGLTRMRVRTFWWVSQLGMLPGTAVFVYAGSQFPDLKTLSNQGVAGIVSPQLLLGFLALGLFPLVVRQIMKRWAGLSISSK